MKRFALAALALSASVGLSGCLTLSPAQLVGLMRPIEMAETVDGKTLLAQATGGDAWAQYAVSILYSQGVGGWPVDKAKGDAWRARATAPRGYTRIPIYIAGPKGKPGYTTWTNTPNYIIAPFVAAQIETCIEALNGATAVKGRRDPRDACGGPDNFDRLRAAWPRH